MKIVRDPRAMQEWSRTVHRKGETIALVPTMGALHEGHLALVRAARRAADHVVVSIFVNPLQFGPHEDFARYPRPIRHDIALLKKEGAEVLFHPTAENFIPVGAKTSVTVSDLSTTMCGKFRPGHFQGVTTIVLKLFAAVRPELAFFGKKDFQQLVIIQQMVRDLTLPVEVRSVVTRREKDGLAMSSRNAYLSAEERKTARAIPDALRAAISKIRHGEQSASVVKKAIESYLKSRGFKIDYVVVCDPQNLAVKRRVSGPTLIALAARLGKTRLIDNAEVRAE